MFKVEAFVEDKNLASVLRALAIAKAYDVNAIPAVNAKASGKKVKQEVEGELIDIVYAKIKHLKEVRTVYIKEAVVNLGYSTKYANKILADMLKARYLKRKSRGLYGIVK